MLTEEQAETKWCPHVRLKVATGLNEAGNPIADEPQTTFNRIAVNEENTAFIFAQGCCIASACMSWRWFDSLKEDGTACHHTPSVMSPRIPEPKDRPLSDRRGFCGLGGRP